MITFKHVHVVVHFIFSYPSFLLPKCISLKETFEFRRLGSILHWAIRVRHLTHGFQENIMILFEMVMLGKLNSHGRADPKRLLRHFSA